MYLTEIKEFAKFTFEGSDPLSIFSNPNARTQSVIPPDMNWFAIKSAVDPVAQLLFTLKMGMPVIPNWYKARCPQVESPVLYKLGKAVIFIAYFCINLCYCAFDFVHL